MKFKPWAEGSPGVATRHPDNPKLVTATISLRADSGLFILDAEVDPEGQFLSVTFEEVGDGELQ